MTKKWSICRVFILLTFLKCWAGFRCVSCTWIPTSFFILRNRLVIPGLIIRYLWDLFFLFRQMFLQLVLQPAKVCSFNLLRTLTCVEWTCCKIRPPTGSPRSSNSHRTSRCNRTWRGRGTCRSKIGGTIHWRSRLRYNPFLLCVPEFFLPSQGSWSSWNIWCSEESWNG